MNVAFVLFLVGYLLLLLFFKWVSRVGETPMEKSVREAEKCFKENEWF